MPFPGGIAASGSKAGSRYTFSIASTYAEFCPTLRDKLGEQSRLARGRRLGHGDHHQRPRPGDASPRPRSAPSRPSVDTPGLVKISAGNYGGRLGKSFIYLHPERQPAAKPLDAFASARTIDLIQVVDFHKTYRDLTAVAGLTLRGAPAAPILGLVGPNGAGKTTTLRALAGIIPPTRGRLIVAGHDIVADPVAAKRSWPTCPTIPSCSTR